MNKHETLKAIFLKVYPNISLPERDKIIVIVNGEPASWRMVKAAINNDTKWARKALAFMRELRLL